MKDVICLRGGLGNQLFQVAFAKWLTQVSRREVTFDISCLRRANMAILQLEGLGDYISARIVSKTRYWPAIEGRFTSLASAVRFAHGPRRMVVDNDSFGSEEIDFTRPAWWFGYWQRDRYARVILPQLLAAIGPDWSSERPTIGIHVRRGDMVDKPTAVPIKWFRDAVAFSLRSVSSPANIRIWSDAPDWCAANLDVGQEFEVVRDGDVLQHLSNLASCRTLIVSRSTYSWWAARIATERGATVIYPAPWSPGAAANDASLIPGSWRPFAVPSEPPHRHAATARAPRRRG